MGQPTAARESLEVAAAVMLLLEGHDAAVADALGPMDVEGALPSLVQRLTSGDRTARAQRLASILRSVAVQLEDWRLK